MDLISKQANMNTLKKLLHFLKENNFTDLHIIPNEKPRARNSSNDLLELKVETLSSETIEDICMTLLTDNQKRIFEKESYIDFIFEVKGIGRFRVNYFLSIGNITAVFKYLTNLSIPFDNLNEELINSISDLKKGLVILSGTSGSGKTTSIINLLNHINDTKNKHIMKIGEPIEFIHQNNKSVFSYRNIGIDVTDFNTALDNALKTDIDILVIDKISDKSEMEKVFQLIDSEKLVILSYNSDNLKNSLVRLLNLYSKEEERLSLMKRLVKYSEMIIYQRNKNENDTEITNSFFDIELEILDLRKEKIIDFEESVEIDKIIDSLYEKTKKEEV